MAGYPLLWHYALKLMFPDRNDEKNSRPDKLRNSPLFRIN